MKNTSIKIRDSLFLNIESIKNTNEIETKAMNKNFYMILDVSYSMSWVLNDLKEDLKMKLRDIMKDWDTLTLARFSSEGGQYEYFTVWFRKALDSDFNLFDSKLDEKVKPLWSTCFSEVLKDLPKIVEQVQNMYQWENIVCFLTDGEPCVSNYQKEIDEIFKNLNVIKVDSFNFIWYTNHYDRNLLSKMTKAVDGQFIHASEFKDYSFETNKVFENFSNKYLLTSIKLPENLLDYTIFSIDDDYIFNQKRESNEVKLFVNKSKEEVTFSYFTNKPNFEVTAKKDLSETEEQYLFASILQLSKTDERLTASEILSYLWDVYLIDIYNNSLTTIELAHFDNEVKNAILNKDKRYIECKKANYLPSPNKFCLLQLFKLLEDSKAKFNYSKLTEYNKTTVTREDQNKEVKFEKDNEPSIFSVNWNQKELNLSIKCKMNGKIDISKVEWYKNSYMKEIETFIFRNYSVISDGKLNMKKLPLVVEESLFNELKKKNVISKNEVFNEEIEIDLTKLPIVNKEISNKSQSFKEIAEKQTQLEIVKAKLKVVNHLLPSKKEIWVSDSNKWPVKFSKDFIDFITEIWITSYGYSPKKETLTQEEENKDYRIARTFEISLKWFSKLPKVEELDLAKKETLPVKIMREFLKEVEWNSEAVNIEIRDNLEKEKELLVEEIREICFSIVLSRTMFDSENNEFTEEVETEYWINAIANLKFSKKNVRMK